jgi:hypothetical protein
MKPDYKKELEFIRYCIKLKSEGLCENEWGFGGMLISDTEQSTLEMIKFLLEELQEK